MVIEVDIDSDSGLAERWPCHRSQDQDFQPEFHLALPPRRSATEGKFWI
jgi:hypothetical protein